VPPVSAKFIADVDKAKVTIQAHYCGGRTSEIFNCTGQLTVFSDQFHYLVAERYGPRDLSDVSDESYINTGLAGEHTADAIARAEALNLTIDERLCLVEGQNLFKVQLEAWMRLLVPNIQLISHPYPEINRVRLSIENAGSPVDPLPPTSTGFGISYVLPIIVSGLLCPPGAMLIVENPEAHLHPSAQSAIGQFLAAVASTGVQVIIETHSENVINGVRLATINDLIDHADVGLLFFSTTDGDTQPRIEKISIDPLAELSAWPRGFFDQQGADLTALMNARKAKRAAAAAVTIAEVKR
jgi:predicted ATPase